MMPGIGDDLDVNEMLFQDEPDDETGSDAPPPADGEGSPADSPEGVVAQAQTAPDGEPSSPGEEEEKAKKDKKKSNTLSKKKLGTSGAAIPLQSTRTIAGDASTKGVQI